MKRLLFICLIFVNAVFGLADADEVTDLCAERWPDDAGLTRFLSP